MKVFRCVSMWVRRYRDVEEWRSSIEASTCASKIPTCVEVCKRVGIEVCRYVV